MDERLAVLDRRVAAAADAWLTDPRDAGVYGRLVAAIEARRAYLNPALDEHALEDGPGSAPPTAGQDHEVLDELAEGQQQARPVCDAFQGEPDEVLRRLRQQP